MAMSSSTPAILPYVALQPDFANVIADVRDGTVDSEDIYLSAYKSGSPSVHGKVSVFLDSSSSVPSLEARDGVELERSGTHAFTASCSALNVSKTMLRVPRQTISLNAPGQTATVRRISAFDVSPDKSLIAAGHLDGEISIQSTSTSNTASFSKKKLHLSTVLSLRFFPSSRVLLSSSSDHTLHIISSDSSPTSQLPLLSVARTLKSQLGKETAHTAAITDTHILGVGKQVLSCSKDGSVRLWDVGSASKAEGSTTLFSDGFVPIMRMAVSSPSSSAPHNGEEGNGEGRVIYTALQNGAINIFDTRTSKLVYASPSSTSRSSQSLLSIAHSERFNLLATGSTSGIVKLFDPRSLDSTSGSGSGKDETLITSFKRSDSSVDDLTFIPPPSSVTSAPSSASLLVATGDGFPFCASVSSASEKVVSVKEEYAAHADEGVRAIRYLSGGEGEQGDIWTAGDDRIVRKY